MADSLNTDCYQIVAVQKILKLLIFKDYSWPLAGE